MAQNFRYYVLKIARVSGWLLLPLLLIYIVSGFSLCGKYGCSSILSTQNALLLHKSLDVPLVLLLLIHVVSSGYLALWRWKKKRMKD